MNDDFEDQLNKLIGLERHHAAYPFTTLEEESTALQMCIARKVAFIEKYKPS